MRAAASDLQGKAIEIMHRADCRLAEEYDAAQQRGEVATNGQRGPAKKAVLAGNGFSGNPTAADLKLTRKRVHEARKHRDAEAADPGLVSRFVQDKIAAGEEPTKAEVNGVVTSTIKATPKMEARAIASIALTQWKELPANERTARFDVISDARLLKQTGAGIEWAQWSWNPITGCLHECPYCYARDIAERYEKAFPHGFAPAIWPDRLGAPGRTKVPKQAESDTRYRNVFACSMADLFGRWVPREWIEAVLAEMRAAPQWNFLCLTKFPKRMAEFEIPANAWMGTTVDLQARVKSAEEAFAKIDCRIRWLSVEPMLERLTFSRLDLFQWIVIGGASPSKQTPQWRPPIDWIIDLRAQARAAGLAIYDKTNLYGNRTLELPFDAPIKGDPTEAPDVFHYLGK
jgi:protein gp37